MESFFEKFARQKMNFDTTKNLYIEGDNCFKDTNAMTNCNEIMKKAG